MAPTVTPFALVCWLAISAATPQAVEANEQQEVVDEARLSLGRFAADPDMTWFQNNVKQAHGMLIIPTLVKGGFFIGGSGGSGALLARDEVSGSWSHPAFYTMGSVTFGLQIGGEASEVVLLIRTSAGMDAMLSSSFKLGGDVSVAAGPVGAGAKAQTADVVAFSRTKGGLYGGLNLEGAVIATRDEWNTSYYGREVRPIEILLRRTVSNPSADPLIAEVVRVASPD